MNLMPFSIFKKLRLGEPKAALVTLQLANRSIKYLRDIVEDVLTKVDKFIFPIYFIVLDMAEDIKLPLILGRPFLSPEKTLIDVQEGKLILKFFNCLHEILRYHIIKWEKTNIRLILTKLNCYICE